MKKLFTTIIVVFLVSAIFSVGTTVKIGIKLTLGTGADEFYKKVWERLKKEKPDYVEITTDEATDVDLSFELILLDFADRFEAIWKEGDKTIEDLIYKKDSLIPFRFYIQDIISVPLERAAFKKIAIGDYGKSIRVTYRSSVEEYPSFSSDGRYLLFISDRSGGRDTWILDLLTGELKSVIIEGSSEYFPHLSPNGKLLLFQGTLQGNWAVYTISVEGDKRTLRKIAGESTKAAYMPTWLNDENVVYLLQGEDGNKLYVENINTMNATPVDLPWRYVFSPFTIDEKTLLVTALKNDDFGIYKITLNGSYTSMEDTRYNEHDPQLSPDGRYLYFTSNRDGVYRIWVKDLFAGDEWIVTDFINFDCFYPAIHPSGRLLAVSVYEPNWEPDIWLIRVGE